MTRFLVLQSVEDLDAGGIGSTVGTHRRQDLLARRTILQCHDRGGGLAILLANRLVGLAVRADRRTEGAVLVSRLSAGRRLGSSPCSHSAENEGTRRDQCTHLNSLRHATTLTSVTLSVKDER